MTCFTTNNKMKPALIITVSSIAAAIAMESVSVQDTTEVATYTRFYKSQPKLTYSKSSYTSTVASFPSPSSMPHFISFDRRPEPSASNTFEQEKSSSQPTIGISLSSDVPSSGPSVTKSLTESTSGSSKDYGSLAKVSTSTLRQHFSDAITDSPSMTPGSCQLSDCTSQLEKSKTKGQTTVPKFSGYKNVTTSLSSTTGASTIPRPSSSSGSKGTSKGPSSSTNIQKTTNPADSTKTDGSSSREPSKASGLTPSFSAPSTLMNLDHNVASELVKAHNAKRVLHEDTQPLKWNNKLSDFAYSYVSELVGTSEDPCTYVLKHSNGPYGENIASGLSSETPNVTEYVNSWYNEIEDYDYNDIDGIYHRGKAVGHFTQLVWAKSQEVGCAVVYCSNNGKGIYILCEYHPVGNIEDSTPGKDRYRLYKENVKPLKQR